MSIKNILRFQEAETVVRPPPFIRVKDALIDIGGHTLVLAFLLICLWATEHLVILLWGNEKAFFGKLPISWVFDAADLTAITAFLVLGIISSINTYRNGEQY